MNFAKFVDLLKIIILNSFICLFSIYATGQYVSSCLDCHRAPIQAMTADGTIRILKINKQDLEESVHKILKCEDCHIKSGKNTHPKELSLRSCPNCHPQEANQFLNSPHGIAQNKKDPDAPRCISCHNYHKILSSKEQNSPTNPLHIKDLCFKCHTNPRIVKEHNLKSVELIKAYEKSVHAQLAKSGEPRALCIDCHGIHEAKPLDYFKKPQVKILIPKVCGHCHKNILLDYQKSIHGKAIAKKILDAPVCTDCHGEHNIAAVRSKFSKVSEKELPKTCASCHEEEKLTEKYGILSKRYSTYLDSYHGIINKYGNAYVANCASCHGYHNILPSSDPNSTINKKNLPKICGKCHPKSNEKFVMGKMHVRAVKSESFGVFLVRKFYTWFIIILMVIFLFHITLDIIKAKRRRRKR